MARRVPKVLVHKGDGALFCNWSPEPGVAAYAVYFTDEDQPVSPEALHIKNLGVTDPADLEWREARLYTVRSVETCEPGLGPYDDETGELL